MGSKDVFQALEYGTMDPFCIFFQFKTKNTDKEKQHYLAIINPDV